MPIKDISVGAPPARVRDEALAAAVTDLAPHYQRAKEHRDQRGSEDFQVLTLDTEDEAKLYGRGFHRLAENDNRLAATRIHGNVLYARVKPVGAVRVSRPRTPKPAATAAATATATAPKPTASKPVQGRR